MALPLACPDVMLPDRMRFRMEREIQFYRDGTVLLVYQLQQDLPLLGGALAHATGAAAQPV